METGVGGGFACSRCAGGDARYLSVPLSGRPRGVYPVRPFYARVWHVRPAQPIWWLYGPDSAVGVGPDRCRWPRGACEEYADIREPLAPCRALADAFGSWQ